MITWKKPDGAEVPAEVLKMNVVEREIFIRVIEGNKEVDRWVPVEETSDLRMERLF